MMGVGDERFTSSVLISNAQERGGNYDNNEE